MPFLKLLPNPHPDEKCNLFLLMPYHLFVYNIPYRRAWPAGCICRVRRASKDILHTNHLYTRYLCSRAHSAERPRPPPGQARETIGYLVYRPVFRRLLVREASSPYLMWDGSESECENTSAFSKFECRVIKHAR